MMRYFLTLFLALLVYIAAATEASALPVLGAAFTALTGHAFAATAFGSFLTTTFTGRLLASVALSALQRAIAPKPKASISGITTQVTAQGGTNPCGFVIGRSATGGDAVCPPMTHGVDGKTPNAYLTYVIALGDVPGQTLDRVAIDGAYVTLGTVAHADYGLPVNGRYAGYAWVKYYDGSQTVADPMLLAKYASYPERPWLADMIGTGVPYAICTFRFNRNLYSGFPALLFECGGIKVYDPRKDSTAGGVGTHRWGQTATYEASRNNAVLAYNIARGIALPGLGIWGGDIEAADLPTASWFAGMNECDITSGTPAVAQYQAGYEVRVDMEPAAVIEELLKGCGGQIAEVGGEFKIRVGGPGMPVMFLTDDDIIVSKPQDFDPFPQASGRMNGIDAKFPDPETLWQSKSAPSRFNATWEAEDGERRVASIDLPACPFPLQVQRVMDAYIKDERRFRRHSMTLPPDAAILEPMDVISWTSARNSYTSKQFDLSELADDIQTLLQRIAIREVDAADYVWSPAFEIPTSTPSANPVIPAAQTLASWDVQPLSVADAAGTPRKPGIVMTWSATDMDAVDQVQYQVRVKVTGAVIKIGSVSDVSTARIPLTEGIVQGVTYQARGLPVARGRATAWTAWVDVTSPSVGISEADLSTTLATLINNNVAATNAAQAELDQLTSGLLTPLTGALATIEARAAAGLNGWLADPIFARWTSGNLTAAYWASRSGTATYCSLISGAYGAGMSVNGPSGTQAITVLATSVAGMTGADPQATHVVLSMEFEYISGDPAGAAIRVDWSNDGVTWTRGDMLGLVAALGYLSSYGITPAPSVRQFKQVLVARPVGTFSQIRLVFQPKLPGVAAAQTQIWHLLNVRAASEAEIRAGNVPSMQASIANHEYALTDPAGALALSQATLNASISAVADTVQGWQQPLDALSDVAVGAAVTVALGGAALGQANTLTVTEGATARVTTGVTNGASVTIPAGRAIAFAGKKLRISVLAKRPAANFAAKFGIAYASADGSSGFLLASANLTAAWAWFTFYYTAPAAVTGGAAYLGLFGDDTKTGKATQFARAIIEPAAQAGDLPEIADMQGAITSIKALDISALTGTAFGTFLTQMNVAVGGTSAWVTAAGAAITTMQGNAAASYTMRVGAGGASAGLEIVAADNPITGPASTIKLSSKHIELIASSLRLSAPGNLFPDYDLIDPAFYASASGAAYTFVGTNAAGLGQKYMTINADAAAKSVETGWFPVDPATEYLVSAAAWINSSAAGSGTVTVYAETGSVDGTTGVVTPLTSTAVVARTDATYSAASAGSIALVTGATARMMRFIITRSAGGTAGARAGAFKVRAKFGAALALDGWLQARHVKTGSLSADDIKFGSMNGRNLTITETLMIATGTGALAVGKASAFDLANDGIYFGRTIDNSGAYGFGFLAGKKIGGVDQYLQATAQTGLKIVNAAHFVTGVTAPATTDVTTSQTITLPVGTLYIDLEMLGGGGGGKGGTNSSGLGAGVGGNGLQTLVQLYDGATNTGVSWSSAGALGATGSHAGDGGYTGASSAYGTGGAPNTTASGYGAGGGGGNSTELGGDGGAAALLVAVSNYSLAALANPKLVITIGDPGLGGAGVAGGNNGGAGSQGIVKYRARSVDLVPASVLPMQPTYTGTITKAAGGVLTFPNYGAGFWCLSAQGAAGLLLDYVETHVNGKQVRLTQGNYAAFISDKTPVDLATSATAVTYDYQFYKLGPWV